jgi:2-hydroxyacyl-CoA lyase 1
LSAARAAPCCNAVLFLLCRYQLPVVIIVFNNGGIYGGDRRKAAVKEAAESGARSGGFEADPIPTAFVANAQCDYLTSAPVLPMLT